MHEDGHFLFPVTADENDPACFTFRSIQTDDGKIWQPVFTSQEELNKGEPSSVISNFIDSSLKACLDTELEGFIINPWGQSFMLARELIEMMFKADGSEEYSVPDDPVTAELLEDGSFLKRAAGICSRNKTPLNIMKLLRILRDSCVWVPCNAVMSDADMEVIDNAVKDAQEKGGLDSLAGMEFTAHDSIRFVPDILQNGDDFFFPVFTTIEEMGEYGDGFSKVEKPFTEVIALAKNNERNPAGIVINAFTEPFVVNRELFAIIEEMESALDK